MLHDDEFPEKLLDCPVVRSYWPEDGFRSIGSALRLDYTTKVHSAYDLLSDGLRASEVESRAEWEPFKHRFSTGVRVFAPTRSHHAHRYAVSDHQRMRDGEASSWFLDPAVDPVAIGIVDRVYWVTEDGRQIILTRPGLEVDPQDAEESYDVGDLGYAVMAWDHEGRQLVVVEERGGAPLLVLRDGLLQMSSDAMIVG